MMIKRLFLYSVFISCLSGSVYTEATDTTWWKLTQEGIEHEWLIKVTRFIKDGNPHYHAQVASGHESVPEAIERILEEINCSSDLSYKDSFYYYHTTKETTVINSAFQGLDLFHNFKALLTALYQNRYTEYSQRRATFIAPQISSAGVTIELGGSDYVDPSIPIGFLPPPYTANSVINPQELDMSGNHFFPQVNQHLHNDSAA